MRKGQFIKGQVPWHKGKHWSEEAKKKMSLSHQGKHLSEEQKKKLIMANKGRTPWNKGKHLSEEYKAKLSLSHKGQPSAMKGKHHTEESKQKNRLAHIGKKLSEETRRKIGKASRGIRHWNWQGGITLQTYKRINTFEWNEIRKVVYQRDKWTCHICGKHCIKQNIQAHHIIPYRISQDDSLENLITLCKSCHMREEHKYYRLLKPKQLNLF